MIITNNNVLSKRITVFFWGDKLLEQPQTKVVSSLICGRNQDPGNGELGHLLPTRSGVQLFQPPMCPDDA